MILVGCFLMGEAGKVSPFLFGIFGIFQYICREILIIKNYG